MRGSQDHRTDTLDGQQARVAACHLGAHDLLQCADLLGQPTMPACAAAQCEQAERMVRFGQLGWPAVTNAVTSLAADRSR